MKPSHFLGFLWMTAIVWLLPTGAWAGDETKRIENLISHVENLKDVKFIRNGSSYDPKDAAKFPRGKWRAKEKEIRTAESFIEKAATVSSSSGKPYLIKCRDGRVVNCGDYLREQSKK